jgi:hypothetical protein
MRASSGSARGIQRARTDAAGDAARVGIDDSPKDFLSSVKRTRSRN